MKEDRIMATRHRIMMMGLAIIAYGCGDALAPNVSDQAESVPDGVEITSVMASGGQEFGFRAKASLRGLEGGPNEAELYDFEHGPLSRHERDELFGSILRTQLTNMNLGPHVSSMAPSHGLRSYSASEGAQQPSFKRTSVTANSDQGSRLRLITARPLDSKGTYGHVGASILLRNDTIAATIEILRDEAGAGITGLRIIGFGTDQKPNSATVARIRGMGSRAGASALDASFAHLGAVCDGIQSLIGPTPVHAQEEECHEYEMEMVFAAAAYGTAQAAVLIACPSTGPGCAVAITAMSVAAAYLTYKTTLYQNCLIEHSEGGDPDPLPPLVDGRTTPGDGVEYCLLVHWYISYDGGDTWHYQYTEQVYCG
jgi:hypothetical protein